MTFSAMKSDQLPMAHFRADEDEAEDSEPMTMAQISTTR
jgi:hypothetical protein